MSVSFGSYLNKYARQKKLALCMWYKIIVTLQHEDNVDICYEKFKFTQKHGICWKNHCFLCQLFMSDDSCTECPLQKKYRNRATYGCGTGYENITPWERVTDRELPKEKRIAAAWEIVEAIKSV